MSNRPVVTFLSDYGLEGIFVGVCRGVIARMCADAHIIDVTHDIPRHDIRIGALALRDALRYLPAGVHIAVADPGVGRERLAVALRTADDQFLVGPDNGILWPGATLLGGVVEAVDIGNSPYRLQPVSSTFHGRDIFAPVAGRLAAGDRLTDVGEPIDPERLVRLEIPEPVLRDHALHLRVLTVDRFGNVVLNAGGFDLDRVGVQLDSGVLVTVDGRSHPMRFMKTFADVECGEALAFVDAQQMLALAVNRGSAAERLGLATDSLVQIRAAG